MPSEVSPPYPTSRNNAAAPATNASLMPGLHPGAIANSRSFRACSVRRSHPRRSTAGSRRSAPVTPAGPASPAEPGGRSPRPSASADPGRARSAVFEPSRSQQKSLSSRAQIQPQPLSPSRSAMDVSSAPQSVPFLPKLKVGVSGRRDHDRHPGARTVLGTPRGSMMCRAGMALCLALRVARRLL